MNDPESCSFVGDKKQVVVGFSAGGDKDDWTEDYDIHSALSIRPGKGATSKYLLTEKGSFNRLSEDNSSPRTHGSGHNSESSEDWDEELGLDDTEGSMKTMMSGFRSLMDVPQDRPSNMSPSSLDLSAAVPLHCKVFQEALSKTSLQIVRYPKPSMLFSLKAEDGFPGLGEKQMESWLTNIILSKCAKYLASTTTADEERLSSLTMRSGDESKDSSMEEHSDIFSIAPNAQMLSEEYLVQFLDYVSCRFAYHSDANTLKMEALIQALFDEIPKGHRPDAMHENMDHLISVVGLLVESLSWHRGLDVHEKFGEIKKLLRILLDASPGSSGMCLNTPDNSSEEQPHSLSWQKAD